MKKIMLSSLVLLPLIVLLILTLGGMVVSKTNYIYVERVEFTQTDTLVLIKDGEERPTAKLSVNVLPLRASNAAVRFASELVRHAMQITPEQPDYEVRGVSFESVLGDVTALLA